MLAGTEPAITITFMVVNTQPPQLVAVSNNVVTPAQRSEIGQFNNNKYRSVIKMIDTDCLLR